MVKQKNICPNLFFLCLAVLLLRGNLHAQFPPADGVGVIIGTDVNFREYPGKSSKSLLKLNTGDTLLILGAHHTSGRPDTIFDCEYYPWIYAQLGDSLKGYVYGKYIHRFLDTLAMDSITRGQTFTLAGESFRLRLCHRYDIGSMNYEGLTGCGDFSPFLVFRESTGRYITISELSEISYLEFDYAGLVSDFGVYQRIESVEIKTGQLWLKIKENYQEGGGGFDMVISLLEGKFYARAKNQYRTEEE